MRSMASIVPPKSYLAADDFPNVKAFVDRLLFLDNNIDEYMKYLEWKQHGRVVNFFEITDKSTIGQCHLCEHLHSSSHVVSTVPDVAEWFGVGTTRVCIPDFAEIMYDINR